MKIGTLCLVAGALAGVANAGITSQGPDVIVGDLHQVSYYGEIGGIRAYAVGTVSCNIGNQTLLWIANSNQHPVIGQSMYRVFPDGSRIEHIGQSWLKHGFTALAQSLCDPCQNPGTGSRLGIGCSDPYSASLNGQQSNLGTKTQVNAFTGFFNWPFGGSGQTGNAIFKRVQVAVSDMTAGGFYYVEGQYVTPDDAAAGNQNNNASFRPVNVSGTSVSPTSFTRREQAAIYAWKERNSAVDIQEVFVPGEGMFNLGTLVIDNGDGTWTYEYALHNQTSHRSADSFSVPADGTVNTNPYFRDVNYHSGDAYDLTDWVRTEDGSSVTWDAVNVGDNTNALRWGTMYNFSITTNTPPTTGEVTIGLFRAGTPGAITATTQVPSAGQTGCNAADIAQPFDVLDLADVQAFIAGFTGQDPVADIAAPFGVWDLADVQLFISSFNAGCP